MSGIWRIACLACCGCLGLTIAIAMVTLQSSSEPVDLRAQIVACFQGLEGWGSLGPHEDEESTKLDESASKPVSQQMVVAERKALPTAPLAQPAPTPRASAYPQMAQPQAIHSTRGYSEFASAPIPAPMVRPATPLPRIAQQVERSEAAATVAAPLTNLPPLPSAQNAAQNSKPSAPTPSLIPKPVSAQTQATQLAAGPELGEALKMLDNMDPEMRKQLLGKGMEMLNGGNLKQLDALLQANPAAAPAVNPPSVNGPRPAPAMRAPQLVPAPGATAAEGEPLPAPAPLDAKTKASVSHMPGFDVGDDHLVLNIHDTDLRQVLELLAEQGGLNILAGPTVEGKVSCSLRDVDVETALDAILKSTGFISRREGKLIFVGTPEEFLRVRTNLDRVGVRVYRLNYVTAKEMQNLLTPMLTPSIGKVTVTSPSQTGIAVDNSTAGGDHFASGEAVLVQDYEAVLDQIDQIVREIDRKPMQVAIEAVIVDVTLNDQNRWGVDFQFLRDQQTVRFGTGTPRTSSLNGNGQPDGTGGITGEYKFTQGGLQFAFLDSSLGAFLTAVETLGDVNVVAHPRLLCMNKQKAEILIGQQIGYVTTNVTQTFSTQTVQFLDVGTQLRLRPFISQDGIVRMEVHPEISGGSVSATGVPSKNVTQVTTNIMCPDGATVVLGGLMQETLDVSTTQVPVIGSLPVLGPLFRSKNEKITRREILVLLTPCIIRDREAAEEGAITKAQVERGNQVVHDEATLLSRTYQSRHMTRRAQEALAKGRVTAALRLAQLAVHFNPNNHEAVALFDDLSGRVLTPAPNPVDGAGIGGVEAIDGEEVSPWVIDALQGSGNLAVPPPYPRDPGISPYVRRIEPPPEIRGPVGK